MALIRGGLLGSVLMSFDYTKSFEVDNDGVSINGNFLIVAGDTVPVDNAPVGSWYFQTNGTVYLQTFSPVGNVWVEKTQTSVLGFGHQLNFAGKGGQENKWESIYGTAGSDKSSAVMPWKSKLIGLTFTNKKCTTSTDAEIYAVEEGNACSPLVQMFKWEIRDKRVARKTIFTTPVIFEAGDKIGVYFRLIFGR